MLIAIDGPAGAGKSSVARAVANELGFTYLDSGAMYRSVGLLALEQPDRLPAQLARDAALAFDGDRVLLAGRDVSKEIRDPLVSAIASEVAADPGVREALVAKQRVLIGTGDWVAEGRDIATVVAPDAEVKVFLTADPRERARRRAVELGVSPQAVQAEQTIRDARDESRKHSALKKADGAVEIDSTNLSLDEVVKRVAQLARAARAQQ